MPWGWKSICLPKKEPRGREFLMSRMLWQCRSQSEHGGKRCNKWGRNHARMQRSSGWSAWPLLSSLVQRDRYVCRKRISSTIPQSSDSKSRGSLGESYRTQRLRFWQEQSTYTHALHPRSIRSMIAPRPLNSLSRIYIMCSRYTSLQYHREKPQTICRNSFVLQTHQSP